LPIALVGLRCSGKSSAGKLLAERRARPFFDSDLELARRFGDGRSAGDLLAELGEPAFRQLEWRTLVALLDSAEDAVIATGGGAVTNPLSRELLGRRAFTVYLTAPPAVLRARAEADETLRPTLMRAGRPLELEDLLALRDPLYRSLAALVVETGDRAPAAIVSLIDTGLIEAELRNDRSTGR